MATPRPVPIRRPISSDVRRSYIQCSAQHKRGRLDSVQWLFRSNIPRKKHLTLPADVQKRNFFGMGEIIGVITNVCADLSLYSYVQLESFLNHHLSSSLAC
jgi:hypothetical protein